MSPEQDNTRAYSCETVRCEHVREHDMQRHRRLGTNRKSVHHGVVQTTNIHCLIRLHGNRSRRWEYDCHLDRPGAQAHAYGHQLLSGELGHCRRAHFDP